MYSQEEIAGIYQRQYKMVYQICFMLMKNTPDAEDAAQTVFRKVIERDTPFRDPEHEKAWLIVTARNECRGQLKHWWRTRREDAAALDTLTWNQPESGLVWEQVAALPEKYRLVLYLHYYQGYAIDQPLINADHHRCRTGDEHQCSRNADYNHLFQMSHGIALPFFLEKAGQPTLHLLWSRCQLLKHLVGGRSAGKIPAGAVSPLLPRLRH